MHKLIDRNIDRPPGISLAERQRFSDNDSYEFRISLALFDYIAILLRCIILYYDRYR